MDVNGMGSLTNGLSGPRFAQALLSFSASSYFGRVYRSKYWLVDRTSAKNEHCLSTYCVLGPLVPQMWDGVCPQTFLWPPCLPSLPLDLGQEGTSSGAYLDATSRAGGAFPICCLLGGPDLDQRTGSTNIHTRLPKRPTSAPV